MENLDWLSSATSLVRLVVLKLREGVECDERKDSTGKPSCVPLLAEALAISSELPPVAQAMGRCRWVLEGLAQRLVSQGSEGPGRRQALLRMELELMNMADCAAGLEGLPVSRT